MGDEPGVAGRSHGGGDDERPAPSPGVGKNAEEDKGEENAQGSQVAQVPDGGHAHPVDGKPYGGSIGGHGGRAQKTEGHQTGQEKGRTPPVRSEQDPQFGTRGGLCFPCAPVFQPGPRFGQQETDQGGQHGRAAQVSEGVPPGLGSVPLGGGHEEKGGQKGTQGEHTLQEAGESPPPACAPRFVEVGVGDPGLAADGQAGQNPQHEENGEIGAEGRSQAEETVGRHGEGQARPPAPAVGDDPENQAAGDAGQVAHRLEDGQNQQGGMEIAGQGGQEKKQDREVGPVEDRARAGQEKDRQVSSPPAAGPVGGVAQKTPPPTAARRSSSPAGRHRCSKSPYQASKPVRERSSS